jgi:hypothetical protein
MGPHHGDGVEGEFSRRQRSAVETIATNFGHGVGGYGKKPILHFSMFFFFN